MTRKQGKVIHYVAAKSFKRQMSIPRKEAWPETCRPLLCIPSSVRRKHTIVITATFLDGPMGLTITKEVNGSAVVTKIIPNGQAEKANIKVSDIIVGVGSNTSTEYDEIMKLIPDQPRPLMILFSRKSFITFSFSDIYCQPMPYYRTLTALQSLNINDYIYDIKSDYFVGKLFYVVKNLSPDSYFEGLNRKLEVVVQGKFLQNIPMDEVYVGQAFEESICPSNFLTTLLSPLINLLQPASQTNITCKQPYILSPLMSTMQKVSIDAPGSEPKIQNFNEINENLNAIGIAMSSTDRKNYFSSQSNLASHNFVSDGNIWTFDFYQHLLCIDSFEIGVSALKVDITSIIGKQAVKHMAIRWKPNNGTHPLNSESIYSFDFFHEKQY